MRFEIDEEPGDASQKLTNRVIRRSRKVVQRFAQCHWSTGGAPVAPSDTRSRGGIATTNTSVAIRRVRPLRRDVPDYSSIFAIATRSAVAASSAFRPASDPTPGRYRQHDPSTARSPHAETATPARRVLPPATAFPTISRRAGRRRTFGRRLRSTRARRTMIGRFSVSVRLRVATPRRAQAPVEPERQRPAPPRRARAPRAATPGRGRHGLLACARPIPAGRISILWALRGRLSW